VTSQLLRHYYFWLTFIMAKYLKDVHFWKYTSTVFSCPDCFAQCVSCWVTLNFFLNDDSFLTCQNSRLWSSLLFVALHNFKWNWTWWCTTTIVVTFSMLLSVYTSIGQNFYLYFNYIYFASSYYMCKHKLKMFLVFIFGNAAIS